MSTPLYKSLKSNGTTIYAFPGAEEDINQISDNYKMYFSKYTLLNLPKVQTALTDEPVTWDFENSFTELLHNQQQLSRIDQLTL